MIIVILISATIVVVNGVAVPAAVMSSLLRNGHDMHEQFHVLPKGHDMSYVAYRRCAHACVCLCCHATVA